MAGGKETNVRTTLLIVRHGQTEWNVERRMQGHRDSPLTALGVEQARWLGEALEREPIDAIYASSSPRAVRTAEWIRGARPIDIIERDQLREIGMGVWEGRAPTEIEAENPEQWRRFWQDPDGFGVPGSETFGEVARRAVDELERLIAAHRGRSILIVTHTVVVKLLMAHFEKRAMRNLWDLPYIHPACLCKVVVSGGEAEIVLHGDIRHYRTEPGLH